MPHSYGYRAHTRDTFSKDFRKHGPPSLSRLMQNYHVGDYVDIKVDGSVHKGMPHRYYQGKTGRVWNVTRRAIGVELFKPVKSRYIKKRFHIRVEHVKKSGCRDEFLKRMKENEAKKKEYKKLNKRYDLKRMPHMPRNGFFIKNKAPIQELKAIPFLGIPV